MAAFYNDNDQFAAAWLRELIKAGVIADGEVDERSIADVRPEDLRGFTQCHFFAGIGGWSAALRLAGWPDDRPCWTGSCPCQPWSAAGRGAGATDTRDLWPAWFRLLRECRPAVVFGEQVASIDGLAWFDRVCADVEAQEYAVGAVDLAAAGVGAFHIRQRLYFVAHTDREGRGQFGAPRVHERWMRAGRDDAAARDSDGPRGDDADGCGADGGLADGDGSRCGTRGPGEARGGGDAARIELAGLRDAGDVALADPEHAKWWPLDGPVEDERDGDDARRSEAHGESRACGEVRTMADTEGAGRWPDAAAVRGRAAEGLRESQGQDERWPIGETGRLGDRGAIDDELGDTASGGLGIDGRASRRCGHVDESGASRELGDADDTRSQGRRVSAERLGESPARAAGVDGFWDDIEWIPCSDGKARPAQSGIFPMVARVPAGVGRLRDPSEPFPPMEARVARLRGYGNAIVAQVAAKFIGAYLDSEGALR